MEKLEMFNTSKKKFIVFNRLKFIQDFSTGFSALDLFEIGYLTLPTIDAISSAWISEALKRLNSTDDDGTHSTKLDYLHYLAEAYKTEGKLQKQNEQVKFINFGFSQKIMHQK